MKSQAESSKTSASGDLFLKTVKGLFTVLMVAVFTATLFTAWPATGIESNLALFQGENLTADPSEDSNAPQKEYRVGLVVGHWGHDVGAICPDSLGGHREVDINYTVADLTRQYLLVEGIQVDLLKEFDATLDNYQSDGLISIHADTCEYIPESGSGFKVAETVENKRPEQAARLMACLKNRYASATGLREDTRLTRDMTSYHAFSEISPETPAVILETGFMNQDRELLTQHPEKVARGITEGILCYLNREEINPE